MTITIQKSEKKEKAVKAQKTKPVKTKPEKPAKEPKAAKPPPMRTMGKYIFLRWVLYISLLVLLGIGIRSIYRGDRTQELRSEIKAVSASIQTDISIYSDAESFAQNFVREYLTYESRQTDDYKKRLSQYCSPRLSGEIAENIFLKDIAAAEYVQTIKTSEYSKNQYDITVLADVVYTKYQESKSGTTTFDVSGAASKPEDQAVAEKKRIYLIVPISYDGQNGYIVEDMPMLTSAPVVNEYKRVEYTAAFADESDKAAAEQMLNNFFRTLYTETQNQIDYYLAEDADRQKFAALGSESGVMFQKVEKLTLFRSTLNNEYTAIVSIKTEDNNGTELKQRFNLSLIKKEKFYAKDINLRTYNLKG